MTTENTAETGEGRDGKSYGAEIRDMTDQVEKAVNRAKAAVSEKIEDGRIAAERMLKRSRYAVEDGMDTAVHQVRRNPVSSVLLAFAAGAMVGLILPHIGRRNRT
jgi:ElaB/YqjD/DUF883 family membrane-anchored ribosome-binding protein